MAYRPRRSAIDAVKETHRLIRRGHTDVVDAVQLTHRLIRRGYTDVVDADLSKYLDAAS